MTNSDQQQSIEFIHKGAKAKIFIRENDFKAFLELSTVAKEFEESSFNFEEFEGLVCDWIESKLSIKFIDSKILKNAFESFKKNKFAKERKISQGIEAKNGVDGKLVLLVKAYDNKFDGTYTINDRYLKKFDIIQKDSIVGRIYPPKDGANGTNIYNKTVPFIPGNPAKIELSPLLKITKDNTKNYEEIVALDDGYIKLEPTSKNTLIKLETNLIYPKGVNHSSGSAIFISNIEINGDVMEGFLVEAGKDIIIKGNVNQSNITSKNGFIKIKGSVIDQDISDDSLDAFLEGDGENQHTIKARGNVEVHSSLNARIFSQSNIIITDSCVRSHIYASGTITCLNAIYASKLSSACGIEAKQLGNNSEVKTIFEFLHPFEAGIEFVELKKAEERLHEKVIKLELFIGPYINDQESLKKLQTSHKNKIIQANNDLIGIKKQLEKLKIQKDELSKQSKEIKFSQLNCLSVCYPHVVVKALDQIYEFKTTQNKKFTLVFDWNAKLFSLENYKPIICDIS